MGEVSSSLLLIGAAYLILRRYVNWRLPLGYVVTLVALTTLFAWSPGEDMVTSPLSSRGQLIFGIGCGLLTALIRFYSGYPEGVCYAILLMNTVRPYVDRYTRPRVLGETKQ